MSSDQVRAKESLRLQLKAEAKRHGPEERADASRALCQRLLKTPEWQQATRVLAFYPLRGEPDIQPVLRAALREEKTLCLPRLNPVSAKYEPVAIRDLAQDLVLGAYGIQEPSDACPSVPINHLDLVLIPGLGFDLAFGRLGRGLGHYDRLLASVQARKCGVAFDWQVGNAVPMEPHDVPVDLLVTPTRWLTRSLGEPGCERA